MTLPWFPDFTKTNASRLLQSCEASQDQGHLFDFIACQLIVDRRRQTVWKVKMVPAQIPDPVMRANRKVPAPADIIVFLPYQHDRGFAITGKPGMVLGTPEVTRTSHADAEFHKKTKEILSGK